MNFEEALVELRKGKKVTSILWKEGEFISLDSKFSHLSKKISWLDIIQPDVWMLLEEPGKTFNEVFEDFKNGKKIRRKSWSSNIYADNEMNRYFISDEILANDWEVVSE